MLTDNLNGCTQLVCDCLLAACSLNAQLQKADMHILQERLHIQGHFPRIEWWGGVLNEYIHLCLPPPTSQLHRGNNCGRNINL